MSFRFRYILVRTRAIGGAGFVLDSLRLGAVNKYTFGASLSKRMMRLTMTDMWGHATH